MTTIPCIPEDVSQRLVSPSAYAEWNGIHRDFAFLRREMPLAVAHAAGYDPFWVVTKYEDVQAVSRRPETFRTNGYRCVLSSQANFAYLESPGAPRTIRALVTMDPPEHRSYRRELWSNGSTASMAHRFEDAIVQFSRSRRLFAGEIIGSGTVLNGCGFELDRRLAIGDVVDLQVEGIGSLRNKVVRA